ncbi:MAG: HPr family phosphocarrier protein [Eubacteriales bacterium]|nr:HPr family phosphocarrier protein [Eubacteriales bacterium]
MIRRRIRLGSVEEVLEFIKKTERLDARIHLVDNYSDIDGKSLLGVLSMSLGQKHTIEIRGNEISESHAELVLDKYMVSFEDDFDDEMELETVI